MKLLVAVPSMDFMHVDFVKSLTNLIMRLKDDGIRYELMIENGTLVHVARDRIACHAICKEFTHVLWIDADMVFGPDLLDDLMFSGRDFVSGIAVSRRQPYCGCCFKDLRLNSLERWEPDEMPHEAFEVAGCGFACVLIKTDILNAVQMHYQTCFLPMAAYGEDLAFCKRATELGYKIYAEPCVRIGHIGHITIYPEERTRWKRDMEGNKC